MSYVSIDNLYRNQTILTTGPYLWAAEKIHGSSSHLGWKRGKPGIELFSGGAKHGPFMALFNLDALEHHFIALPYNKVIVFGEVYGGSMQKMKATYGDSLRFVAFEVHADDVWLDVPDADRIVQSLGLEFVAYEKIPNTLAALDAARDKESEQAIRNGMGHGHLREGVVLHPEHEMRGARGNRILAKHKGAAFSETKTPRTVDEAKVQRLNDAKAIAEEYVNNMRLQHVLDKFPDANITMTGDIIRAMIADVAKESVDNFEFTDEVNSAIGRQTAFLFKQHLQQQLTDKAAEIAAAQASTS